MFRMPEHDFNRIVRTEIRVQMLRQEITQREMARRLDWPLTTLHRRLNGETAISAADLALIAITLDVSLETLGFALTTTSGAGVRP
jgi:transcriptional regulator with XRE-family HTH domain